MTLSSGFAHLFLYVLKMENVLLLTDFLIFCQIISIFSFYRLRDKHFQFKETQAPEYRLKVEPKSIRCQNPDEDHWELDA